MASKFNGKLLYSEIVVLKKENFLPLSKRDSKNMSIVITDDTAGGNTLSNENHF